MFTIYEANGKKSISLPARRRFDRTLSASVFWKVTKPIVGNKRLSIEIKPSRPLIRLPKFVLCASIQGRHIGSYNDENSTELMTIQEQELDAPQTVFRKDYEITLPKSSQLTKNSRLFLFAISSVPNECYTSRWASGFSGIL
jgi:hypothetical protein